MGSFIIFLLGVKDGWCFCHGAFEEQQREKE